MGRSSAQRRVRGHLAALAASIALAVLTGWTVAAPARAARLPAGSVPPVALRADAAPGLTIVGAATYDVLPEEARVHVTVVLTATNNLKDTKTKRVYFRAGYVTVLPNTEQFKLTGPSGKPKVTVSSKTDTYINLKLDFGANLGAGKSTTLTLTYDIKDPGGAPDRPLRISHSLVSFAAWAVAAPGSTGASVTVRFPAGYDVEVQRGPLDGPTTDGLGRDVWTSGRLAAPLDFVAGFSADRPTEYVETQRAVKVAGGTATITLQTWPDDAAWEERVGSLIERAVPILEREIGLPWPSEMPLVVHETLVRSTDGFAGIYDPGAHRIDVAYAAPDAIVLHELAHAWFNGGLVADRWIAEGFASHYAEVAAKELGIDPVPVAPPDAGAPTMPLNDWGDPSADASGAEAWGYTASLELANAIAARAGDDALRTVWVRAASNVGAYQPIGSAGVEPAGGPPDWRGLLDLVEEISGQDFTDLWRKWVARPQDLDLLADRATARGSYARTLDRAGDWHLPVSIRSAMRAWRFDVAREQLAAADAVLAQRAAVETAAAAAGVTLPGRLRTAFEGDAGLAAAAAEATAEQAVVEAIAGARAARPTEPGVGEQLIIDVGLLFQKPDAQLADAVSQLGQGRLEPAYQAATSAESAWRNAADAGRSRILSVLLLGLATALLVGLVRRGLMPPPPGMRAASSKRGGTLAGHPAGTAEDEGGAATQA